MARSDRIPPPVLVEHDLVIPGLDPRHEGVRLAHLSDIHVGDMTPRGHVRAAVDLANCSGADVIALTGSLPVYDARFERALRVGGRLFVCIGNGAMLEAVRVTRTGPSDWSRENLFEAGMPALLHAPEPPRFVF